MARLLLFNKPYGVVSQFTEPSTATTDQSTLSDYIPVPGVYAAGRLDKDSEGLLLLTDDGALQYKISNPKHKMSKCYYVQVEGTPDKPALDLLSKGVLLKDGMTAAAKVSLIDEPGWLWPRNPPVRFRKSVSDSWLKLTISEGRNRQVRRMTAAVGHPTLRLVRYRVGSWTIDGLDSGEMRED